MPLLFDARDVGWLQITARERVYRHALLGVTHVAIPVKLFTDEEAAWEYAIWPLSQGA